MLTWPIVLQILQLYEKVSQSLWSYENAAEWKTFFPLCDGPLQSPIDLVPEPGPPETEKLDFRFAPSLAKGEIKSINTGRNIEMFFTPKNISVPMMEFTFRNQPHAGTYRFEKIIWHWGEGRGYHGSEHAIKGKFFDAEAQMFFFNTKYGSYKEAQKVPGGLAAVAVLMNGGHSGNPLFPTFKIDLTLEDLAEKGSRIFVTADLAPMKTLMNTALTKFYSYHGSLTTPPCSPVVIWMVSAVEMEVELDFINQLFADIFADGSFNKKMIRNWRPIQPSRGRVIRKLISPS